MHIKYLVERVDREQNRVRKGEKRGERDALLTYKDEDPVHLSCISFIFVFSTGSFKLYSKVLGH